MSRIKFNPCRTGRRNSIYHPHYVTDFGCVKHIVIISNYQIIVFSTLSRVVGGTNLVGKIPLFLTFSSALMADNDPGFVTQVEGVDLCLEEHPDFILTRQFPIQFNSGSKSASATRTVEMILDFKLKKIKVEALEIYC